MADLTEKTIENMRAAGKAGMLDTGNAAWDMLCDLALRSVRQEPVAYTHQNHIKTLQEKADGFAGRADYLFAYYRPDGDYTTPLYAAPPSASPEVRQEPVAWRLIDKNGAPVVWEKISRGDNWTPSVGRNHPDYWATTQYDKRAADEIKPEVAPHRWEALVPNDASPPSASVEQARREALEEAAKWHDDQARQLVSGSCEYARQTAEDGDSSPNPYEKDIEMHRKSANAIRALTQGKFND